MEQTEELPLHSGRLWGLDLLRALAVLAVVLYHYPKSENQLWLRALSHYGWAGVDLFFVLSGYLIAGQCFSQMKKSDSVSIVRFYLRRFMRTLPNYFVVLAVYLAFSGWASQIGWKYLIFVQNFGVLPYFSHSWSLCVEEQFYLIFPFVAVVFSRWWSHQGDRIWVIPTAVIVAGACFRFLAWRQVRPDLIYANDVGRGFEAYLSCLFYPTHARLDGLTVGITLAAVRVFRSELWKHWLARSNRLLAWGLGLLVVAAVVLHWRMSVFSAVLGFPLLALGFGAILVCSVSDGSILSRVQIPGVSSVALLSYAIYLTHGLALELALCLMDVFGLSRSGMALALVSALLIPACAGALYVGVERPFMRLRKNLVSF